MIKFVINHKNIIFLSLVLSAFFVTSCYYDSEEELYQSIACELPEVVTYQSRIADIMQSHCNDCHNASNPSGNVITTNYNGLFEVADNGRLFGAVNHLPGYRPMPLGLGMLPECDIEAINAWIDAGAPEQ